MVGPDDESLDRCVSCGHDLRAGARFCDACGRAVTSVPAPSEFKQVTVLFADVVGSMRLAVALHPERLQAIMHELFNRGAAVVQRFQGIVEFTGDGLMALFGAPVAVEDHALRACIAALEIQAVTKELSAEVFRADGVELRIRVGLNSGEVVAGEISSWPRRYTAVGHPVGMAQRMESAAPPDGVLCSQSTALLVERSVKLGPRTDVRIKGSDEPVPARQLLGVQSDRMVLGRNEGELIGRYEEFHRLSAVFDARRRGLVGVVGEAGLGKTRLVGQFLEYAAAQSARIVLIRCEAHTTGVSFRAMARLMRAMFGVESLSRDEARSHTIAQVPGLRQDSDGARILFDAMGFQDNAEPVVLGVDGRRRKLGEMMARAVRAHPVRTVFVLEDVHWIDGPSDEVIAAFAAAMGGAESMFVTTYRPEFRGALHRCATDTVVLHALSPADSLQVVSQVLGGDPSVSQLSRRVAESAAGNPFFAEEIIRDLAGRGLLEGSRGGYRMSGEVELIAVPSTVQAVLAARIDRLSPQAKSILNAAAVIGSRFDTGTLQLVQPQATPDRLAELVAAELIDQTEFLPAQRYCFHHPLVRSVAYDSQLHATRAGTHVRLAAAIQQHRTFSEEKSAIVAAHLEAAGEFIEAHRWHMRAADWLRPRDLPAARAEWDSARRIADRLPVADPEVLAMRIAPRTMLHSTSLYVRDELATESSFRELYELSMRSGDETSLAIAMAGRSFSITVNDCRADAAKPIATQLREMAHRIPCDSQTRGIVLNSAAFSELAVGEFRSALAIAEEILDLPPDCPEAEIAAALSLRGFAENCLGDADTGRKDMRAASDLSRLLHPVRFASVQLYSAILAALGIVDPASLLDDARSAWELAESFGDICGIILSRWAYGTILLRTPGSFDDGIAVLGSTRAMVHEHRLGACALATVATDLAVESARGGHVDAAIDELRGVFDATLTGFPMLAVLSAEALVDLLIGRGSAGDLAEAKDVLERWRARHIDVAALNLWLRRAEALLAGAEGDGTTYDRLASHYLRQCERMKAVGRLGQARQMITATTA